MTKKEFSHLKITLSTLNKQKSDHLKIKKEYDSMSSSFDKTSKQANSLKKLIAKLERDNSKSKTILKNAEKKKQEILVDISKNENNIQTFRRQKLGGNSLQSYRKNNFDEKKKKLYIIDNDPESRFIGFVILLCILIGGITWICAEILEIETVDGEPAGSILCCATFIIIGGCAALFNLNGGITENIREKAKSRLKLVQDQEKEILDEYEPMAKQTKSLEGKLSRIEEKINRISNVETDLESETKKLDKLNKTIQDLTSKIQKNETNLLKLENEIEQNIKSIANLIPYSEKLNLKFE